MPSHQMNEQVLRQSCQLLDTPTLCLADFPSKEKPFAFVGVDMLHVHFHDSSTLNNERMLAIQPQPYNKHPITIMCLREVQFWGFR